MKIIPQLSDNYLLPTIYDDVCIAKNIKIDFTLDNNVNNSFTITVGPNNSNSENIERVKDIQSLLKWNYIKTQEFLSNSHANEVNDELIEKLRIDIKDILNNYRTLLDYTSHYIAQVCQPIPSKRKVQFPIANITVDEQIFRKKLSDLFPNLETRCNELYEYLICLQHFKGDKLLSELNELVNESKHRKLNKLVFKEHKSLILSCDGVGLRIGELGFNKLELEDMSEVRLLGKSFSATITGPLIITANNYPKLEVQNLVVKSELLTMLTEENSSKSIAGQVWSYSSNIFRIINNICVILNKAN